MAELVAVHRLSAEAGAQHASGFVHALNPDVLLLVRDDHPPDALFAGQAPRVPSSMLLPAKDRSSSATCSSTCGSLVPSRMPLDESARLAARAGMLVKRRERRDEPVGEAVEPFDVGIVSSEPSPYIAGDDRREPPEVRATQRAPTRDTRSWSARSAACEAGDGIVSVMVALQVG